jgi:LPXTG-motif cell wall-anchored protein
MPTQTPIPADESTITDEETKPEENTTNNLEDNPKTGDNILIWINLIATSVIGLTLTIKLTKKRENEEE